jgi:CRP/FNR family transcriptional regulator, cyclic AMP receptor protein
MSPNNATEEIVALLAGVALFRTLAPDDVASCAAGFRQMRFSKGEMLFARGDPGTQLYVVAKGQVRLAIANSDGREFSFQIAGAGALFGEIAVLDGWPRSAEAMALTETIVYTLERGDFHRLRATNPAISEAAIAFLCQRLRDVSDKLETIALFPMDVRLARFLLAALGDRQASAGRRVPLELSFSQSELALLIGASRPKINAALSALEAAGAIGRTSDRLFCDRDKLALIAQRYEA